jgi:cytochrome c oxidase cbb3-type subunit 3
MKEHKERDELREHSYDGIQEYDNDLPRWWVWLFIICIIYAAVYPFVFDFGPGEFASETIDAEIAALHASAATKSQPTENSADALLALTSKPEALAHGGQIFQTRCVACHGSHGEGLIGPNLADEYWLHGGTITDLLTVIENGVLAKGMLAWKGQLTTDELRHVTAYVWSLHGSNPPNPKAPQGEKFIR